MIDLVALTPLVTAPYLMPLPYSLPKVLLLSVAVFSPRRRPIPLPMACLWLWCLMSTLFASDVRYSWSGIENNWGAGLLCYSLIPLIYISATPRAVRLARVGAMAVAVLALFESAMVSPLPGRAIGTLGSPIHLGAYLAILVPGATGPGLVVLLAALAATNCRGAMLAAAAGLLMARRSWRIVAVGGLVLTTIVVFRGAGGSDEQRVRAWRAAIKQPITITGQGPGMFIKTWAEHGARAENYVHLSAHNDLLEALTTTGVVGLGLYVWCWAWAFRNKMSPELVVLFIILKFNPLNPEVAAVAALVIGGRSVPRDTLVGSRTRALRDWLAIRLGQTRGRG